jgi:signal transduction protein with GAF and PtsI domain
MSIRDLGPRVWAIWGLIVAFGAIQAAAWTIAGGVPRRPGFLVQVIAAWIVVLVLASMATRRIESLSHRLSQNERAHLVTLDEVEQLQMQNAMLQIIARSVDVTLAFQALATRIARLVPCDRVGLALLAESGQEFQTYTARVREDERRIRPRPEVVFKTEGTAIGSVVRTREALILNNMREAAPDYLDANVMHTAGFASALLMPLVSKGRAVGTINVVSRKPNAFEQKHVDALQPIAEIFAVACVAQHLQNALGRFKSMEAMSDMTLAFATEINGALQTIIGHCDLLERGYPDPNLQRDLATVVHQAQRISTLLEKMRAAANDRLKQVAQTVSQDGIPSSPEAYGDREVT